ncbi:MAG: lipopolysaccharide biosynthesis protein [Candidatus Limnocylindria bacterium]
MVLSAGLGAVFWWVAARLFSAHSVGVAVAAITTMSLVASLSFVGAGTVLIRDLHAAAGSKVRLAGTAVLASGAVAAVAGTAAGIGAGAVNPALAEIGGSLIGLTVFVIGVALTTMSKVVDEILLGLLRSVLVLSRNALFSVTKIVAVAIAAFLASPDQPLVIYVAWTISIVVSLSVIVPMLRRHWRPSLSFSWVDLKGIAPAAAGHQVLNTTLELPSLAIPAAVGLFAAPATTAQFYMAFMLASAAFFIPTGLSGSLYAVGARRPELMLRQARMTIGLALVATAAAVVGMIVLSEPLLRLFGDAYGDAAGIAPWLAAASIPLIVKDHFQVVARIRFRERLAVVVCGAGAVVELAAATVGLVAGGLPGLAIAWLAAVTVESLVMGSLMLTVARSPARRS